MKHKPLILLLLAFSLLGCKFGFLNLSYPDSSSLVGTFDSSTLDGNSLSLDIDRESTNKTLILKAVHYNKGKEVAHSFTFSSPNLPGECITPLSSNLVAVNLGKVQQTGLYSIIASSDVDAKFNKEFVISLKSSLKGIRAEYSLNNPIKDMDYDGADKGEVLINSPEGVDITLSTLSEYTFNIYPTNEAEGIEELAFDTDNLDGSICYWSGTDKMSRTLVTGSTNGATSLISIRNANTNEVYLNIRIHLKEFIQTEITEAEKKDDGIKYISLTAEGENARAHIFNIELKGTTTKDRELEAYISPLPSGFEDIHKDLTDGMWQSSYKDFVAHKSSTSSSEGELFRLSFDGKNRTITIFPLRDTVDNGENLYFWLYIRDSQAMGASYLGRWRISIGGMIEQLSLDREEISGQVSEGGSVTATSLPKSNHSEIFWYISKDAPSGSTPPRPTSEARYKNLITASNTASVVKTEINGEAKEFNIMYGKDSNGNWRTFAATDENIQKAKDGVYSISSEDGYILGNVSGFRGLTQDGECLYRYSLGSVSGDLYLTAFDDMSGKFSSIPVKIHSSGSVELRSVVGFDNISYLNTDKVPAEAVSNFSREPGAQRYPNTAENNSYGAATRSFYFPHNKISTIDVFLGGNEELKSKFTVSPTYSSSTYYDLEKLEKEDGSGFTLVVTPKWKSEYDTWLENRNSKIRPPRPGDTVPNSKGKVFADYVGIGWQVLKINDTAGNLRIVIYDAGDNVDP